MPFVLVAIDGPTGVGKSTLAKRLAKERDLLYVDTGAMFRCLAWCWRELGQPTAEASLSQLGQETHIEFRPDGSVRCNQTDVTEIIRSEAISSLASQISQFPAIRDCMKQQQRQLADEARKLGNYRGAVLEGRDIGTVVLPHAELKFYLDAQGDVRAKRRFDQLKEKGAEADLKAVHSALVERDQRDQTREIAPLKPAEDARIIDTTEINIDQVLDLLLAGFDQTWATLKA